MERSKGEEGLRLTVSSLLQKVTNVDFNRARSSSIIFNDKDIPYFIRFKPNKISIRFEFRPEGCLYIILKNASSPDTENPYIKIFVDQTTVDDVLMDVGYLFSYAESVYWFKKLFENQLNYRRLYSLKHIDRLYKTYGVQDEE
jgi:hypothetical protein